jgi:hypothetical protein
MDVDINADVEESSPSSSTLSEADLFVEDSIGEESESEVQQFELDQTEGETQDVISLVTPLMVVTFSKKLKPWVWEHFKKMATKGECVCTICNQIVWYTLSFSTNILLRHIECHHPNIYSEYLLGKAQKVLEGEYCGEQSQKHTHELTTYPITSWLQDCPNFHKCMVNFMVATYQAYRICEEPTFRELCMSLNKKSPNLS